MTKPPPSSFEQRLEELLRRSKPPRRLNDFTLALHEAMARLALSRHAVDGQYNMAAAARDLGIRRGTLYKILCRM